MQVFRRVCRWIVKGRLGTELAVELDVALRLDVVLAALRNDRRRRPDEQLDVLRHLALAADNLSILQKDKRIIIICIRVERSDDD